MHACTRRYDGALLVGARHVPSHGFEVHESVDAALAATYPADARLLHAPRALLEVLVGGQPLVSDGKLYYVQLTPVRLLADPERFAALHRELYGDAYYLPAPPLTTTTLPPDEPPPAANALADPLAAAAASLARAPWPDSQADLAALELSTVRGGAPSDVGSVRQPALHAVRVTGPSAGQP